MSVNIYNRIAGLLEKIYTKSEVDLALNGKVSKETGKSLSTNDYTTAEKNKLANIEAEANKYILPTASANALGGIKIGSGLSIDVNGVVSANGGSGAAEDIISDAWNSSTTYGPLGNTSGYPSYAIRNNKYYRCVQQHTGAAYAPPYAGYWVETDIATELSALNNSLTENTISFTYGSYFENSSSESVTTIRKIAGNMYLLNLQTKIKTALSANSGYNILSCSATSFENTCSEIFSNDGKRGQLSATSFGTVNYYCRESIAVGKELIAQMILYRTS